MMEARAKPKVSIARKMARSNVLQSSLALVLATLAFLTYDFISFRRVTVETLSGYADMIGINTASALIFADKDAAAETLNSLRVRPDILQAVIYDDKGRLFVSYRPDFASPESADLSTENVAGRRGYWIYRGHLIVAHDIRFRDQYLGMVYLEASLHEITYRALRYVGIGIGVILASVLLSWLISRRLQRRITEPIFALTRVAERVSSEADYSVRVEKPSDDEVGVLAEAFNNMLGQIELQNVALIRARAELERRVVERTRELADEVEVRRRTEQVLRENEERFRALVELAPDAVIKVSGAGEITLVNSQAERLFGYAREELLNKKVEMLVPPEYTAEAGERWLQTSGEGGITVMESGRELEALRKDGRRIPIEVRLSPIGANNDISVLAIVRNISARKEAERAITSLNKELREKVAALTAVNGELEAFSYSVSHDLRAPLRAIDGFSHSLLEDCDEQLDELAKSYLARICAAAQRMGMLIDDLLNLSRITRAQIVRDTVDMSAMVRDILAHFAAADRDRLVRTDIQAEVAARADVRLLRVALENLLGNAWKFTRHAAEPLITFGAREEGGETVYFVRDNGAGFNMTYVNKLFEPFQRLHAEREYEGTGIGLAIVQRVIQRHGGRIWAEGAPGDGASFYFTTG